MRKRMGLRIAPPVAAMLAGMVLLDRSGIVLSTLAAALLHECGHLLGARLLQIPLGMIRIDFFGARMEVTGRMLSYGEEWLLAAAGPLFSLLFAAAGAFFWNISDVARIFSCASLVLGLLNLLPIRTFDGGRMLECMLSRLLAPRTVGSVMRLLSFVLLFLLWTTAVYFLLRAGDGLSLFCFSVSLLLRFFDGEKI